MALSGEQWLQRSFFPVVESLPATGAADPQSPTAALTVIAAMRLQGALDALAEVGVLDDEQQERCRAALEPKGVTSKKWEVRAVGGMTALMSTVGRTSHEPVERRPDRLVRVVGSGQVFGLVEDEQAVLLSVEVWQRTVRAGFLFAVSAAAEAARSERAREMQEWFAKKQAGEIAEDEPPPMRGGLRHPGAATTWLLSAGDGSTEGRVVAGQGGTEWWRVDVEWPVTVPPDCRELEISATEQGRVVGRLTVTW